ncbi:SDR family oxidoreductase [Acidimicrobiaceae bacterium]|jgi:3-oxoacyl-[acyl-carrier protein] reductase|nr:SDR family oxidoreductase [Acidimicrobiaceae bacterium]
MQYSKISDILILGSSKGLGKDLYNLFESDNLNSLGVARTESNTTDFLCDLSIKNEVEKLIELFHSSEIMPKNIIFNAGQGSSNKEKFEDRKEELMKQNLYTSKNFIEILKEYPTELQIVENFIFINSICALENFKCSEEYKQTKSALLNYSRILAKDFLEYGIRVNSILPGNIMHENSVWNRKFKDKKEEITFLNNTMPNKTWIFPEDIYKAIRFLIENKNIVNTEIILDGGQNLFSPD